MPKRKQRNSQEFRVASMLAIILDEPYDNPENPDEVRIEQARGLLSQWSSARGSLIGALAEVVNLKQGNCVRCPERPCPECGAKKVDGLGL